jgi:hypothetical protein
VEGGGSWTRGVLDDPQAADLFADFDAMLGSLELG